LASFLLAKQLSVALFISDEHELNVIGKNNAFKVISQVKLASCVQRNYVYMCDKHQVLGNNSADTCLFQVPKRVAAALQI
jgi:hypothetical protein